MRDLNEISELISIDDDDLDENNFPQINFKIVKDMAKRNA